MVTVKTLRAACLIACVGLVACATVREPPPPAPAPAEAPAPVKPRPEPEKPAEAPAPPPAPPQAAPEPPPAPKAAKKSAPRRKAPARKPAPPPAPKVVEPPVIVAPAPSPEQERARRLEEYLAALQKSQLAFNPPSPMQVERRVVVPLSVDPPKEAAQLAEELRKSLAGAEAWRPRLRAQLGGASFEIAPVEGKDFAGEKDLAAAGRTEWTFSVVPKLPGTKQLTARVAILLPPGLGGPRELPALQRDVTVEATLAWTLGNLWSEYWQWILAMLALAAAAIAWWARRRSGAGR
jgi:hypothetical protein